MAKSLYISADLEGICGVVSPKQCYPEGGDNAAYRSAVAQQIVEIEAVIQTAFEAGVEHVLVNDAHASMRNVSIQPFWKLSETYGKSVELLSGKPKLCAMMAGLDSSFDAACLVGYHGRAGSRASILAHTFHPELFDVQVNGRSVGEAEFNTWYAQRVHGVPVILASGDNTLCEQIEAFSSTIATVETKKALTFSAAINHDYNQVLGAYQVKLQSQLERLETSLDAFSNALPTIEPPFTLKLTYLKPLMADLADMLPGFTRVDGCSSEYQAADFSELYRALQSSYSIIAYKTTL